MPNFAKTDKTLVLFTSCFPYGTGETFLESELPYLLKSFARITIITNAPPGALTRPLPAHVQVISRPYELSPPEKLWALKEAFSPQVKEELDVIRKNYKLPLSKPVVNTVLQSFYKAGKIAGMLDELLAGTPLNNVTLYSYWADDNAVACAYYRLLHPEVKAVTRAHGWDVYFERHNPAYLPFRNFILKHLTGCYCISQNGLNYLNERTGKQYNSNLYLARLGTANPTTQSPTPANNKLTIVSCSTIVPLKRVQLIAEAISLINDIPVEWIHFGGGSLLPQTESIAKQLLGTKPNVSYTFKGQVSNTELLDYYGKNAVSLFINVSETEGLPVSFMEAMSYHIPVVATNVGGVAEMVATAENGFLLSANPSAHEVADTLRMFFQLSATEQAKLRETAYRTWQQNYNAENNYTQFAKAIAQ